MYLDSAINISLQSAKFLGGQCFSGGLLGPDGTNWHLGKWCKKAQNQGSNARAGDLITIGADGRGGRIKVIRSPHQSSLVSLSIHPLVIKI